MSHPAFDATTQPADFYIAIYTTLFSRGETIVAKSEEKDPSEDPLAAHLALAIECWTRLGERDVFHSVVTSPIYKGLRLGDGAKVEAFYRTGVDQVAEFERVLEDIGIHRLRGRYALDFGCGVGRVTFALASRFERVAGVDVSYPHLVAAADRRKECGHSNVELVHASNIRALRDCAGYDFACSTITLQHLTPPLQAHYVGEICAGLEEGGVAILHAMTEYAGYRYDESHALSHRDRMQMHPIDVSAAVDAAAKAGAGYLGSSRDPSSHGLGMRHEYLVFQRPYP